MGVVDFLLGHQAFARLRGIAQALERQMRGGVRRLGALEVAQRASNILVGAANAGIGAGKLGG